MGRFSPMTLAVEKNIGRIYVSSVNQSALKALEKSMSKGDTAEHKFTYIPWPLQEGASLQVVFSKRPSHKPGIFRYSITVYSRSKDCREFIEAHTNVYIDWTNTAYDVANLLIDVCKELIFDTF